MAEDVKEFAKSMEQRESRRGRKVQEVESEQDEASDDDEEEEAAPRRRSVRDPILTQSFLVVLIGTNL